MDMIPIKCVAIITKTGNGYSAHLPHLPGCITAAHAFEETRDLIREAADHAAALLPAALAFNLKGC